MKGHFRMLSSLFRCALVEGRSGWRWASSSSNTTHFGFQDVTEEEKAKKVAEVFTGVAEKYDLMNDAMSAGIHRLWKDYFVKTLPIRNDVKLLDVAGGTGDITFRVLRRFPKAEVTVCDINQGMLDVGKRRAETKEKVDPSRISWICGDGEKLPFEDNSFDAFTISFGIRNCTHVDKVLSEAQRVLRPGGLFACLEFSKVSSILSPIYDFYSFNIIPVMGEVIAKDYKSYKYLVESIRKFPNQTGFAKMISEAGLKNVKYENLTFGVCAIHTAKK